LPARRRRSDEGVIPRAGRRGPRPASAATQRSVEACVANYFHAYTAAHDSFAQDVPLGSVSAGVDVVVVSRHTEVPGALRSAAEEKVARFTRFASDIRRVEIDFDETRNHRVSDPHRCEILVHLTGHLVRGRGDGIDASAALDLAVERVELQMRRLHGRRKTRKGSRRDGGPGRAVGSEHGSEAGSGPGDDGDLDGDGGADGASVIVKAKSFVMKPMSADEAALQMELLGHDFYLFTSSENGRASVIYRRRDGDLGLIEAGG